MKFSDFFTSKSGMIKPKDPIFGGENYALEKHIKSLDWKLNINFAYTGRHSPT
jgi:hypothetical protein